MNLENILLNERRVPNGHIFDSIFMKDWGWKQGINHMRDLFAVMEMLSN